MAQNTSSTRAKRHTICAIARLQQAAAASLIAGQGFAEGLCPVRRDQKLFSRMASGEGGETATHPVEKGDVIVQYIILRRDLWNDMGWPRGSVVAQACHASIAVVWQHQEDSVVQEYCAPENLDKMHKVCQPFCMACLSQAVDYPIQTQIRSLR